MICSGAPALQVLRLWCSSGATRLVINCRCCWFKFKQIGLSISVASAPVIRAAEAWVVASIPGNCESICNTTSPLLCPYRKFGDIKILRKTYG